MYRLWIHMYVCININNKLVKYIPNLWWGILNRRFRHQRKWKERQNRVVKREFDFINNFLKQTTWKQLWLNRDRCSFFGSGNTDVYCIPLCGCQYFQHFSQNEGRRGEREGEREGDTRKEVGRGGRKARRQEVITSSKVHFNESQMIGFLRIKLKTMFSESVRLMMVIPPGLAQLGGLTLSSASRGNHLSFGKTRSSARGKAAGHQQPEYQRHLHLEPQGRGKHAFTDKVNWEHVMDIFSTFLKGSL